MAYDRAITVFSPDGRLFQVEYAREAVKRGTTTVGMKFSDGGVLIVDKRVSSRLVEPGYRARLDAQINEITYNEKIQIKTLVKRICDFKQTYTQYGGVRPFGTALLIAGVDKTGPRLFSTDPSGALMEYKANSEGAGRTGAMAYFEEKYTEGLNLEDAVDLGVKAMHKGTEGKLNPDAIEIGIVQKDVKFHILSPEETKSYVTKAIGGK
jgi:proteasome alpha subunit